MGGVVLWEREDGAMPLFGSWFWRERWSVVLIFPDSQVREGESPLAPEQSGDSLLDLISSYGQDAEKKGEAAGSTEAKKKSGKGKGGEKWWAERSKARRFPHRISWTVRGYS
jgi:hypothetical protein